MKNPSPYLKMRVLGAIDMAESASLRARTKAASALVFTDEDGHPRRLFASPPATRAPAPLTPALRSGATPPA
jgi:hypothetical protein